MTMLLFFSFLFLGCTNQDEATVDVRESDFTHLLKKTPKKFGNWNLLPDVVICQNAPVSKKAVMNAIDFWRSLGYRFGRVLTEHSASCFDDSRPHYQITIEMNDRSVRETSCGETALYLQSDSHEILGARIYIRKGDGNSPSVLEHEFGHALGWRHFRKVGHLMNPLLSNGGFDTYGLESNFVPISGYGIANTVRESDVIQVCSDYRKSDR